ncbi:hypothetical protein PHYBOEH_002098 [Phytophthora boehmeriae]|uniref:Uncharacterized protein n=1 Tax=Phytophthora boehmeriae TaxID=109152 RepID=A0A8T1X7H5_9STRA|nr:hypothetical protein PHYBOEH_002098 [Phytophthora boehmeriae]
MPPTEVPSAPSPVTSSAESMTSSTDEKRRPKASLRSRRHAPERTPTELLQEIGLMGKEVVAILKERGWEVEEPSGLQQHKVYHTLEGRRKGNQAEQGTDYFVGEGELYAFIIDQGGLRYLLPDECSSESEVEPEMTQIQQSQSQGSTTTQDHRNSASQQSVQAKPQIAAEIEDSSDSMSETSYSAGPQERKWKRRKKLSTARGKSVERDQTPKRQEPKSGSKNTLAEKRRLKQSVRRRENFVKDESAPCNPTAGFDLKTDTEYQASLTARGWRAQLLRDVEVHLLRAVAAIDRAHSGIALSNGRKKIACPSEGVGPHATESAEIVQEMKALIFSIHASQRDLSSMITGIIAQAEHSRLPDRIDCTGRIGIPSFVSTGQESLTLMRDIERYLLLFVAAVRRYQRTKEAGSGGVSGVLDQLPSKEVKRADLRAIQLRIDESTEELQEISHLIKAQVEIPEHIPHALSSSRSVRVDTAADTTCDHVAS